MFFMALCVSRFHSFARIKFCGGEEVGFDAFDGGFDEGRLGRTQVTVSDCYEAGFYHPFVECRDSWNATNLVRNAGDSAPSTSLVAHNWKTRWKNSAVTC
jgi:hypothetical protein